MRFYILLKGRRPFPIGTTRKYGNYHQKRHESGWAEVPREEVVKDGLESKVTEPGSEYKDQSHPPRRMPVGGSYKRKKPPHAKEIPSPRIPKEKAKGKRKK